MLTLAKVELSMSNCSLTESHPSSATVCHNPSMLQFLITKTLGSVGQMRVTASPARVLGQEYVIPLVSEVFSASQYLITACGYTKDRIIIL
jgi:hypothetical protein